MSAHPANFDVEMIQARRRAINPVYFDELMSAWANRSAGFDACEEFRNHFRAEVGSMDNIAADRHLNAVEAADDEAWFSGLLGA